MLIWLFISIALVCFFAGLFLLGLIYQIKNSCGGEEPILVGGIFGVFALGSLIGCACTFPYYNSSYIEHKIDIMSISRGDGVEGHFSLGFGSVKDVQYYFYYYTTDKGVLLGKIRTDNSYVIETSEYVPSIYEIKEKHTFEPYNRIYVPIGTIITTYVLN